MQLLPRSSTAERMNPTPPPGPGSVQATAPPSSTWSCSTTAAPTPWPTRLVGRHALHPLLGLPERLPGVRADGGRAYGSVYPGPIGAVLTPSCAGSTSTPVDAQTAWLPYASSLCGACFDACPVRIDIPDLLVHLRAKVVDHKRATRRLPGGEQLALTGAALVLGSPGRLAAANAWPAWPAGSWVTAAASAGRQVPLGGRVVRLRDLPAPPPELHAWWKEPARRPDASGSATRAGPRPDGFSMRRVGAALVDRLGPGGPRDYRRTGPLGDDVVELFAERVAEYKADVRRVAPDRLPAEIAEALRSRGARRVTVPPRLPDDWLSEVGAEVERHSDDPLLTVDGLERLDGVVTSCAVAIAETGTIILNAGPGQAAGC